MRKGRFSISTVPRTIRLMFLFGTSRQFIAKMFTSAQICQRLNIKKVSGHEEAHRSFNTSFLRAEEIMKTSTKDKIEGSFHEVKGAFKEQVGKATNDRALKAEGKSEKRAGKVQQQLGRAKDSVAHLKATLKQTKATRTLHK